MNKMVVNHIEKLFVTNDAATIMNELDVSKGKLEAPCAVNFEKLNYACVLNWV